MDLQGKIEKFNVPEIFQLIASGRRTGTLGLIRNNQATMFYFRDGQITYAYLPGNRNRLGQRLIARGLIDNETLEETLASQKESKGENRLGRILIDNNRIDSQQLNSVLSDQISDIVYKVMSWDNGIFKFYDNKFPTDEDNGLSLSTEKLILDGARRADELNNLKSKLPEFDTRMAWKKSENNHNVELSLSSMEWNIMSACDGARTIDDIINAADYDPADILKTLADFIEKGLIGPADSASGKEVNTSHLESQIDILADLLNRFLNKA